MPPSGNPISALPPPSFDSGERISGPIQVEPTGENIDPTDKAAAPALSRELDQFPLKSGAGGAAPLADLTNIIFSSPAPKLNPNGTMLCSPVPPGFSPSNKFMMRALRDGTGIYRDINQVNYVYQYLLKINKIV